MLGYDVRVNMSQSKYKKLGIRNIKCLMVDDSGYPFWLCVTYYNRVNDSNNIYITNIKINLTTETTIEIENKILSHLNDYLESKDKPHRFRTYINYGNVIRIDWYNSSGSDDYF
jgi:hypothetical protein